MKHRLLRWFNNSEVPATIALAYVTAVAAGSLAFWLLSVPFVIIDSVGKLSLFGFFVIPIAVIGNALLFLAFGLPVALFPFLLVETIALVLRIRSVLYFLISGGLIALVTQSFLLISAYSGTSPLSATQLALPLDIFFEGGLGGLVFWWIAVKTHNQAATDRPTAPISN